MTALAFVVGILALVCSGFAVYRALKWPERVDEGRVRSDGPRFYRSQTRTRIVSMSIGEGCAVRTVPIAIPVGDDGTVNDSWSDE